MRSQLHGGGRARVPVEERDGPRAGCSREDAGGGRHGRRPAAGDGARAVGGTAASALHAGTGGAATDREWQIQQGYRRDPENQREHGCRSPRQHHADARNSQHGGAGGIRDPQRAGDDRLTRRGFLLAAPLLGAQNARAVRLTDVTKAANLEFSHNSGAFGAKYLPETLGSGCAFLDYDGDGWLDILLVNGCDWSGHKRRRSTLKLYRNNRNGSFTDVTEAAGLAVEMYGMGVAVGDYDNDGNPDLFVTAVGQSRLFRNTGK